MPVQCSSGDCNGVPPCSFCAALVLAIMSAIATAVVFPYLAVRLPKIRESRMPLLVVAAMGGLQTGVLTFVLDWPAAGPVDRSRGSRA